jgi:sialic acid synthase SpsE
VKLGWRGIGDGFPVLRAAALGGAHEGDLQLGYRLVETAGAAGAEAVVVARGALTERDFKCVLGHAGHVGLLVIGAVASTEDVPLLVSMDVDALRLEDAELSPLLAPCAATGRPLVLSLSEEKEEAALRVFEACPGGSTVLLLREPGIMASWQARWPEAAFGALGHRLRPEEPSRAALIETEHRLPVSLLAGRNRP